MLKDAAGREIKPGQVILHISRKGSATWTDIGVVRVVAKSFDSLIWNKVYDNSWRGTPSHFARGSVIYRADFCVVLPELSRADLVERYHIREEGTDADDGTNQTGSGRPPLGGV